MDGLFLAWKHFERGLTLKATRGTAELLPSKLNALALKIMTLPWS
jgi:hypothetical protein